ncbi:unnamed protein product [Symbiodinium sp. CCMP2592]|nr:unnamed protein product [Symbiodinium sp. CCMP2592]
MARPLETQLDVGDSIDNEDDFLALLKTPKTPNVTPKSATARDQDTQLRKSVGQRRLSFGSTGSGGSWGRFEQDNFDKCLELPADPLGINIADTGPCGVGRVVREAWDNLAPDCKKAGQKFAAELLESSGPLRVTTLCSGTDGVVFATKEVLANLFMLMVEANCEFAGGRLQDYDLLAEEAVKHEMSVDIDPHVQDFIKLSQAVPILGSDIADAADVAIWNLRKGEFSVCPESTVCFCSWVVGLCDDFGGESSDSPDGVGGSTNQDEVMAKLRDCGYEVRCVQVCPTLCGVPMTRQRLHYQGILRKHHTNASTLMDALETLWLRILNGKYSQPSLLEFLDPDDGEDGYVRDMAAHWSNHKPQLRNTQRQWRRLHKHYMESSQAI